MANVGDEPAAAGPERAHPDGEVRRRPLWRRALRWAGFGLVAVVVAIQFVPFGWWHDNPPVVRDAPWPDERSASIARTSCYACHSNETDWPLYSYVAPMSWLVRDDVERGRDELNFSDWDAYADEAEDAIEVVADGEMPPGRYTLVHRGAELTGEEAQILIGALGRMAVAAEAADDAE